jgi:hypothetical protein
MLRLNLPVPSRAWTLAALTLGLAGALACDRQQVGTRTPAGPAQAPQPMGGSDAELPPPPRPTGSGALKWDLPKGWTETQGSGMRFATLTPPGAPKAELSVVVLPGPAGGELANVNRWRGQIGLPPWEEPALASARKAVKSRAGSVSVYDFASQGAGATRMVAGILSTPDGNIWFLKLMGDADAVGKAKADALKVMESLRLD